MRTNIVREKWSKGGVAFGAALSLGSVRSAEIFARAGFDFLMVDTLHGHFDKIEATNAIRAIAATDTVPFARVSDNTLGRMNDLLDAGALGIVVPMVNSARDAQLAVEGAFYHPKGERSRGSAIATFYGKDYHARANDLIILVVMIETAEAVSKADEILAVKGVDACLIGSGDLALSLGCSQADDAFRQAVANVASACRAHGVAPGIAGRSADDVRLWQAMNMSFFLVSHDLACLNTVAVNLAGSLRKTIGP